MTLKEWAPPYMGMVISSSQATFASSDNPSLSFPSNSAQGGLQTGVPAESARAGRGAEEAKALRAQALEQFSGSDSVRHLHAQNGTRG